MSRAGWYTVALCLTGCGPSPSDDGNASASGSGGSTTSPTSSGADDVLPTAGDATVADTTVAATSTTDTTDTTEGTETGEDACPPAESVMVDFTVEPEQDVSDTCMVTSLGGDPGTSVLELDCGGQLTTVTLTITPDSAVPQVSVGQSVYLQYITDLVFWTNRWLAIHSADGESDRLLVGAVSGSAFDPPGTTLDALFDGTTGPSITPVSGLCPLDAGRCSDYERIALDLELPRGGGVRVFDQGAGLVDILSHGYWLVVQEAAHHPPPHDCTDYPTQWYQFATTFFPSD